jgi:hypothetical protein
MIYIFREEHDQDLEIRIFECLDCTTEVTVCVLPDV